MLPATSNALVAKHPYVLPARGRSEACCLSPPAVTGFAEGCSLLCAWAAICRARTSSGAQQHGQSPSLPPAIFLEDEAKGNLENVFPSNSGNLRGFFCSASRCQMCRAGSSWGAAGCCAGSAPAALCSGLSCRAKGKGLWAATWPRRRPYTKTRFSCAVRSLLAVTTPADFSPGGLAGQRVPSWCCRCSENGTGERQGTAAKAAQGGSECLTLLF